MKKKKIILIAMFAVSIITAGIYVYITSPNINDKITVYVSDISVEPLTEEDIEYADTCGYNLSNDTVIKMREHMGMYKIISIHYKFENKSETTTMADVRFYPCFDEICSKKVITFNSDNGAYYIFLEPKLTSGMTQYIIIESDDITESQIYNELAGKTVELVYYTGHFGINTGHGLKGMLGRHTLKFQLPAEKHGGGSRPLKKSKQTEIRQTGAVLLS